MALLAETNERIRRMEALMLRWELPFQQVFGQRIYGPPKSFKNNPPPTGWEIFVSNIPRDVFEDEIITLFANMGNLYQVKFMMEYSGMNRGFAYVLFLDHQTALYAIKKYHGYLIKNEHRLACYMSLDNSRLYFEGLPTTLPAKKAKEIITTLFNGDADVLIFPNPCDDEKNLGVGFVKFATHRKAADVRKLLWPSRVSIMGSNLFFEWACPLPDFNQDFVVLVLHLTNKIGNNDFIKFVTNELGVEKCICNITKHETFATIQFMSKIDAIKCEKSLYGKLLDGVEIKPIFLDNTKYKGRFIANIILFLQWGAFDPKTLDISCRDDFCNSTLLKLSSYMGHHLRKTNKPK
ncbi:APOBEC1 complementation factor-like [Onthophagus taurus]|uniref:APOBEC1 complementation factor-like n=1 Tax=Onthophagus taurus TaxID=166361 RepID=UPI0039BDCA6B